MRTHSERSAKATFCQYRYWSVSTAADLVVIVCCWTCRQARAKKPRLLAKPGRQVREETAYAGSSLRAAATALISMIRPGRAKPAISRIVHVGKGPGTYFSLTFMKSDKWDVSPT